MLLVLVDCLKLQNLDGNGIHDVEVRLVFPKELVVINSDEE